MVSWLCSFQQVVEKIIRPISRGNSRQKAHHPLLLDIFTRSRARLMGRGTRDASVRGVPVRDPEEQPDVRYSIALVATFAIPRGGLRVAECDALTGVIEIGKFLLGFGKVLCGGQA